ncbi:alpha/beta hydrolase fold domain-containing protein [Streptomyces sp. NPDC087228]|uniref:alpha/beta hydrolase fold domain-containing protein n=1 Tax=Streptomyces sp. NPDC087228 TaxID=3365772 RepID=UPI003813B572
MPHHLIGAVAEVAIAVAAPGGPDQPLLLVGIWDRAANLQGWQALLGDTLGTDHVSPCAAPARADDLSGLPPTYLDVGDPDLFRDEDLTYANRLMQAGVPVELHVYPGGIHAGELLAPDAELSTRITNYRMTALNRAPHSSRAPGGPQ